MYHHEEDESSFRLVDTARVQKQPHHNKRIKYSQVSVLAECREIVVWGTRPFTREEGSGNIATPVLF